ncbi:hypothetical protein Bca52824_037628 [Brassica carinata]|uniref:Uncharacterized protein n=1 Tax=Brassica carinata TaxID=52824 RepID=A0A8X7RKZ4_BRACI|nr:hypothetical protein Bca52824_037628 [Brassica carinata]
MTSVMSMQLSCGSLKNPHPLEAPVALVMIISSGIALSVSSSNSSLAGSNTRTFPMLTPPGEGFTLRLSDIYGPVMEDENERTLMLLLCICQLETFETIGDNSGRIRCGASLRKSDSRNGKDDKATPVGGSQRERRSLLDVAGDREIVTQFEIKRSWVQGECISLCSCNSESGTPLIWDAVHDLLDHNVDPNAETEDNVTPLLSAVAAGSMACLELLVKAGAKANVFAGGAT